MGLLWRRLSSSPPLRALPALPPGVPSLALPPFVVEERLEEVKSNGAFTPRAALWLSPHLGESGLLRELSSSELHLLLGVMACLTPNATFLATSGRVAGLLGLPHRVARQGLEQLCERHWQGVALLRTQVAPTGMRFFLPSFHLLEARRSVIGPAPQAGERAQAPQIEVSPDGDGGTGPRDEVVARSRALYTKPRAQVEADIEAFLASGRAGRGLGPPSAESFQRELDTTPAEAATPEAHEWLLLHHALLEMGVPHDRTTELLATYPLERIRHQLEWLPLRQARSPIAYLLSAIERDYAPPAGHQIPKDTSSTSSHSQGAGEPERTVDRTDSHD